ncbi:MAG: sigma-54 interaction domain-containing protein, partial [Pirellulales bacterium]
PEMNKVISLLKRIAPTNATVLIQGETGTGKELVAQAIHQNSPRKNKTFVPLNCAALSENILESELFGHVRGAFTDASSDRVGKFEYAHGGTLFLDEVGDMPTATQIKLLRVLESGEITRVGSNEPIKVNVRLLSATNRNLEQQIEAGAFRSDLYHRLKVVTVTLPRLVERSQDIPLLIEHFMRQFAKRHQKTVKSMSTAARRRLLSHDWPGNVRELRNTIESMVVVDFDGVLDVDDLPAELADQAATNGAAPLVAAGPDQLVGKPLSEIEQHYLVETLKLTGGNREEAAALLGIGARTLYRKIKEYQVDDRAINDEARMTKE